MSYGEELTASNPTHSTVVTIRSGVTRDGRLTVREVRTVHASGAYGAMKPRSFLSTSHYVGGGYSVPNMSFEFLQVYTNTTPGGYFRVSGAHQYTFALECHTDLLARELGMDPAAFRANLPLTITVEHKAPQPADVMYFSAQVAEVEVDRETGQAVAADASIQAYVWQLEQDYNATGEAAPRPRRDDDFHSEQLMQELEDFLRKERERGAE